MSPVSPVGIAPMKRTIDMVQRGPYLSHMGPKKRRITMVPQTATMELVQICCFEIPMPTGSGSLIVDRRGVMLNQQKKARKKEIQETWKPRMWGRAREFSLISVALQVWG